MKLSLDALSPGGVSGDFLDAHCRTLSPLHRLDDPTMRVGQITKGRMTMTKGAALVMFLALLVSAVALIGTAGAGSSADYYWLSFEAEQAVSNSDWGDARGVDSVDCRGLGAFQKQYGNFKFKRFRCELKNSDFNRIGFVTIRTTAPETWKPENFVRPRCS